MSDDNIVSLKARLEVKAENRRHSNVTSGLFRILARAIRQMREEGASSKEIAHTMRIAVNDLDKNGDEPA